MKTRDWIKMTGKTKLRFVMALGAALALGACGPNKHEVGGFSNDLLGNEITIDALHDPEIPGVVCHLAFFNRSFLDRAKQGNWFENPSNSAVSCQRTGTLSLKGVSLTHGGEEIFSQGQSLLFKRLAVRRIVDLPNRVILYVAYSRELVEGSAKISISSVALTESEAASVKAR
jgi:CreA protein